MLKSLNVFDDNLCTIHQPPTVLLFENESKINLIDVGKCEKTPYAIVKNYYIVLIDGKTYNVLISDLTFSHSFEVILKAFKKMDDIQKQEFLSLNSKSNNDYYDNLRRIAEEKRIAEIKRMQLEEQKRIEEIKKIERTKNFINASNDSITTLKNQILLYEIKQKNSRLDSIASVKIQNSKAIGGVLITDFQVISNDYDVTDVTLSILNSSSQRIKYVTFVLQAFNSVDDPIHTPETVKGVGFVEINEFGTWDFENVWFDKTLENVQIKKITIIYEDGTSKVINDISKILISNPDDLEGVLQNSKSKSTLFGSIIFKEFDKTAISDYEIWFLPINFIHEDPAKNCTVITVNDIPRCISEIEEIMKAKRNNEIKNTGMFETTEFTSMIYIKFDKDRTLISLENLELLLAKMKSIL